MSLTFQYRSQQKTIATLHDIKYGDSSDFSTSLMFKAFYKKTFPDCLSDL